MFGLSQRSVALMPVKRAGILQKQGSGCKKSGLKSEFRSWLVATGVGTGSLVAPQSAVSVCVTASVLLQLRMRVARHG